MSRPRALVLAPRLPWPLDDGGRIAAWQTVWAASRAYDTTLVALVPPHEERAPLPASFADCGVRVVRVAHRPPPTPLAALRGVFGRWPYTLARYRSHELSRIVRALVADTRPAFTLVNHLHLATLVDDLRGTPMILREHNVEHVWMRRYAHHLAWRPAGLYARVQARRLRGAEAELCRRAALVLAIQEEEAEALRRLAPDARVEVLPLGVDLNRFATPRPVDPPVVLLAASFAWQPNVDGAMRFVERGWPRVLARLPGARLRIAGKELPRALSRAAERAGAEAVGYVESMPEEFARAAVLVVPVWVGAGARVKIVEALAARLPVVATRLAAEGLQLTPGEHYVLGESASELGDQVAALLVAPSVRAELARRGRVLAEERWSLEAVAKLQNKLCAEIVG